MDAFFAWLGALILALIKWGAIFCIIEVICRTIIQVCGA